MKIKCLQDHNFNKNTATNIGIFNDEVSPLVHLSESHSTSRRLQRCERPAPLHHATPTSAGSHVASRQSLHLTHSLTLQAACHSTTNRLPSCKQPAIQHHVCSHATPTCAGSHIASSPPLQLRQAPTFQSDGHCSSH